MFHVFVFVTLFPFHVSPDRHSRPPMLEFLCPKLKPPLLPRSLPKYAHHDLPCVSWQFTLISFPYAFFYLFPSVLIHFETFNLHWLGLYLFFLRFPRIVFSSCSSLSCHVFSYVASSCLFYFHHFCSPPCFHVSRNHRSVFQCSIEWEREMVN